MNYRMITVIAAAVSVSLLSCVSTPAKESKAAATQAPAWLSDLSADYPDAKYLAAVGEGDTRRDAENDATGALAKQFTVSVKVDTVAQQRYSELTKGDASYSESERSISQSVGTQASEQFVNLRFSDAFVDKAGRNHIVAYIERLPTAQIYKTLITKDLAKVEQLRERAAPLTSALQRYAFYDAAYNVSLNAERMNGQLRIIHAPSAQMLESQIKTADVAVERDAEVPKLAYRLTVEGDADGKIAGIVKATLAAKALSEKAKGPLAVKASWLMEPVEVNPKFKSVRWTINISLADENGAAIATVFKESRENGLTDAEARAFAYREVEKRIKSDMIAAIDAYLNKVATTR